MRMDNWGFCGRSPPIITLQARIRDRLIALQPLLENGGSSLESQAIRSTFLTQSTPVPSVLLSEQSRNKERGHMLAVSPAVSICRSSARCSVDLEDNPPLPVNWSSRREGLCCKSAPHDCTEKLWPLDPWRPHRLRTQPTNFRSLSQKYQWL